MSLELALIGPLDEDDEPPPVDDAKADPLHCPRCERKTLLCGDASGGTEFSTNLRIISNETEWLPTAYKGAVNAPEATSERRFMTNTGTFGHCGVCKLIVQATLESH